MSKERVIFMFALLMLARSEYTYGMQRGKVSQDTLFLRKYMLSKALDSYFERCTKESINKEDANGITPLMLAVITNQSDVFKKFLDAGGNPYKASKHFFSAFSLARDLDRTDIKMFIENKDKEGYQEENFLYENVRKTPFLHIFNCLYV